MTEVGDPARRVPWYTRIDVIGGALLCAAAAAVWLGSANLPVGELRNFGSGFLPHILSAALMTCGAVLLVRGLLQAHARAERLTFVLRGPVAVGAAILVFALTIRGFPLGPVEIPQLGLLVAGPLTVFLAGMGSAEAEPRQLIVLGIGLTVVVILVFAEALGTQIPIFPAIVADALPSSWGLDWPRRIALLAYSVLGYGLWRAFGLTLADLADRANAETRQ